MHLSTRRLSRTLASATVLAFLAVPATAVAASAQVPPSTTDRWLRSGDELDLSATKGITVWSERGP